MTRRHLESQAAGLASDELYAGGNERVRTELMRLTGYFHTESSHHASEYWPWFRKDAGLVKDYLQTGGTTSRSARRIRQTTTSTPSWRLRSGGLAHHRSTAPTSSTP